jgi:transposase InsO family protein
MKQRQLRAIQPKNFLTKNSDGWADRPCANLLAGESLPQKPDQAWAGDITFIPTSTSWLYLAVVIDLGSRRIVDWNLATHMRAELDVPTLEQALQAWQAARGAIFHSDRGSQYGSIAFRSVLEGAGLRQSTSARANPYDNA